MKCESCGHANSSYSIVCEKCGAPLKIEENELLQKKYHDKGKHIDIEEIVEIHDELDFNKTRKKVRSVIVFVIVFSLAFLLYFLATYLLDEGSKEVLNTYSDYMENSSLALFYFGDDNELDSLYEDYSKNYGFDYLNIQTNKISQKNRRKIQRELNVYNVTSALVIVKNGVPLASFTQINDEEKVLEFLQVNEVIPQYLGDTEKELETFKNVFDSENPILLYFPTSYHSDIEKSEESIKAIAEQYDLEYQEVKGYILSKRQLLKLMSQLGYTEIQDDLILYIIDGKVEKAVIDTEKKSYFQLLSSYGIIDTSTANYLVHISENQFFELMKDEKSKHVILIGSNECNYCDRVKPVLGQLANQKQIVIYYLDASNKWDMISEKVKEMGLETGLTSTPFMMIVEKNIILGHIVGPAKKDLYLETLTEMGVIR